MTLVVPDVGEVRLLSNALGKVSPPATMSLRLFATNTTPAEGDTWATYTEAAGGGYAAKTLTGTSWTVATVTGTTTGAYAQQVYTFTGALTTNPTIYGYVVLDTSDNTVCWAELAAATFTPANNGDTYSVTPQITLA